jgi:flagellar protein FliS
MDKELKQDFTRRLSQCNSGEMIVIIYDIFFAYTDEAKEAYKKGEHETMKAAVRKAQRVLDELCSSLDFSYKLSGNLFSLYVFCKKQLARTMYENRLDGLGEAEKILRRLYTSFEEAARQDDSPPMMQNTQQVYAGMTYNKGILNENYMDYDDQRGFFA